MTELLSNQRVINGLKDFVVWMLSLLIASGIIAGGYYSSQGNVLGYVWFLGGLVSILIYIRLLTKRRNGNQI